MITATGQSSSIATDVAIGRVVRAAVKARAGATLTSIEQGAARDLRKILIQRQKDATASLTISKQFVSNDKVRATLQKNLAATLFSRPALPVSSEQMDRLLAALEALSKGNEIDKDAANELVGFLHRAGRPIETSAQSISTSLIDGL